MPRSGQQLVDEAVAYLRPRLGMQPRVGLVLGSGLGSYADRFPDAASVGYAEIPGFPVCHVAGHRGRVICTDALGVATLIMQGRVHRYEGYSLEEVTRPVRIIAALGAAALILSCAAGALRPVTPGHLMLVRDHLNLLGDNPLIGEIRRDPETPGFVELAPAYDLELLALAEAEAARAGLTTSRGVLACVSGPSYETSAEAAMLTTLGADAVSMSTVPEVIIARALGLRVLALALITNRAGVSGSGTDTHGEVVRTAEKRGAALAPYLDGVIKGVATVLPKS